MLEPNKPEPVYTYKKGVGWVPNLGVEILARDDEFIVVDLADVPGNVRRGYAPWHPNYNIPENDGGGIEDALRQARRTCEFMAGNTFDQRGRHVCAVRKSDYHKLVKYEP